MTKRILIFHDDCADGLLAAYIAREAMETMGIPDEPVVLHPAKYGQHPPDVRDARVVMVDFSYKRPVLEAMLADCAGMVILDHHDSAVKELEGLASPKLTMLFDMDRSGAGLAWDYYHENEPRPALVNAVEDYDLWHFIVPHTREICAAFRAIRFDASPSPVEGMAACRLALSAAETWDGFHLMVATGRHVLSLRKIIVDLYVEMAEFVSFPLRNDRVGAEGHVLVYAVECPPEYASEVGNALCEKSIIGSWNNKAPLGERTMPPFSVTYRHDGQQYRMSLRSLYPKSGIHVGDLARLYGGGGHPAAAGFETERFPWDDGV